MNHIDYYNNPDKSRKLRFLVFRQQKSSRLKKSKSCFEKGNETQKVLFLYFSIALAICYSHE